MIKFILGLWQLPQNILGFLWYVINKRRIKCHSYNRVWNNWVNTYYLDMSGAVTLGQYIFIGRTKNTSFTLLHEEGHVKQSLLLGPLYLVVIGIPSLLHAFFRNFSVVTPKKSYYSFFTEKWANKLMDI